jgi:alcohol oxidase
MCSNLLVMMYTRASASDYDEWKTKYQNPGWGSNDLIPLLRKVCNTLFCPTHIHLSPKTETYQVTAGGPTHGANGPLRVSEGGLFTDLGQQFLDVSRTLDPDRALAPPDTDTNDLSTINVYTVRALILPHSATIYLSCHRITHRDGLSAYMVSGVPREY